MSCSFRRASSCLCVSARRTKGEQRTDDISIHDRPLIDSRTTTPANLRSIHIDRHQIIRHLHSAESAPRIKPGTRLTCSGYEFVQREKNMSETRVCSWRRRTGAADCWLRNRMENSRGANEPVPSHVKPVWRSISTPFISRRTRGEGGATDLDWRTSNDDVRDE